MTKFSTLFVWILIIMATAMATDYHVDPDNGDDLNDGLSKANAWATVNKANQTLVAGDRVFLWPGDYGGSNYTIDPDNSGSERSRIYYIAATRDVVLDQTTNVMDIREEYITVQGFVMKNAGGAVGPSTWEGNGHVQFINCIIPENSLQGYWLRRDAVDAEIYGCTYFGNGGTSQVTGGVVIGATSYSTTSRRIYIRNCTIIINGTSNDADGAITVETPFTEVDSIFIENCIIAHNGPTTPSTMVGIDANSATNVIARNNIIHGFSATSAGGVTETGTITTDPQFVGIDLSTSNGSIDAEDYNTIFVLKASSPAIGAGTDGLDLGAWPLLSIKLY